MDFRNISAWAIRNPVPPLVLFFALMLAGIVSFRGMDVNSQPDISFPAALVLVSQPGAAPTELETQVTQRVEAAIRSISGVEQISSTVSEGSSQTVVTFQIGTPVDRAVNDVRDAISQIRGNLPEGILEPQVQRLDIDGGPIANMSAESTDMTLEELSWYIDNTVAKRLLSIEGMAAVNRNGGVSREIRVNLDPVRLQAEGITAAQVNAQLRQVNLNAAGGRAEIAGSEQSVRVLGNARNAYELGETQITVGGGRSVRLSDIAQVRDAWAEQRSLARMNGRQVLAFSIEKAKGYSDVTVYGEVKKALEELEKANPKVTFKERFTSVKYTQEQYTSAIHMMLEGAALAIFVVFIFLRDWRATLIAALAIPLSAIPSFWFMDMMGFTLNSISLLALSLVAGVLVDDAIVEIENIVRHMRMGKSAYQAAIDAADEIGLAVLATTMAIVGVFLPVGLMSGIAGQFFIQFGFTVVIAVLLSLAVARLITPLVAAYFLKAHGEETHGEGKLMDIYMSVLRWSLNHRWWTVALGGLAFVATIISFATLPMTFQPVTDNDFSRVSIKLAPGATLQQTEDVVARVEDILEKQPEVASIYSSIQVATASMSVTLAEKRDKTSQEFERDTLPLLAAVPDARVNFQNVNGGDGTGRAVTIFLGGDDPQLLNTTAMKVVDAMRKMPELRAPRIEGDLQRPEITIKPRLDLAADLGVTTQALSQTIRIATLGDIEQNSAKFSLTDRQIPIRVALEEDARQNLSTIENLPVPTSNGGSVPLKVVADIGFGAGPTQISRIDQVRQLSVGTDLAQGVVAGEARQKINQLPIMQNLPQGVRILNVGEAKWQGEMVMSFIVAVISGVFLVFAVLVLLYRRLLPPFVNMGSLLLAPLGGALALHIAGEPVSLPVFIGLLMLLGIVAKNSILVVDFALEEMNKGIEKTVAIIDAGHKRAQPIVMTTVAMVAGMVPTALSLSGDGAWRAPMGITVIGGLILSTLLTLVIVPATFSLAIDLETWLGKRLKRVLTYKGVEDHGPAPVPHAAE